MLDVIGIGFGPANIALAIALEELTEGLNVLFLEKRGSPRWQEGMLLEDSDIQNHPLRDLVTPRNPRSRYSFTNFLFENNRLFEHLNLGLSFPLRIEYEQYVRWVADLFAHQVQYGANANVVKPLVDADTGALQGYRVLDTTGREWRARSVVVAPGRTPNVPAQFANVAPERVVHLNDYLFALQRACEGGRRPRVAVVGGSQSAVEILLHAYGLGTCEKVVGITRNFGFRQKDTSPFSDEVYFPQFVRTFFNADQKTKDRLRAELEGTNYSSADKDVLDALYVKLYANRILQRDSLAVRTNTEVSHACADASGVHLALRDTTTEQRTTESFDLVVLATGFLDIGNGPKREAYPGLLAGVAPLLELTRGHLDVSIDYRVRFAAQPEGAAPLYLNGLCESSHGMGDSGSFSLLALRSAAIAMSLCERLAPSATSRPQVQRADHDLASDTVR
ncbi:SidA/IucD/PvdA family monooxygenase [Paraburkholderia sp. MMS20-SJTR3]|uniref:SidA/IucD/PvdA family monooxygenase n=1 Tax=Paraburkholderia sejongensis TaxID=2886946 RepID=A0ABS8K5G6_9BURK|nr:SidA/IucD/PvdA family monooxygenase [Paraburkholderia sp. MMS20-SJTR3]MCC8397338.1 SidA/IucD/PvdA family monooxygenase [Paraburkholderia sp. MMS20-SJTR3]